MAPEKAGQEPKPQSWLTRRDLLRRAPAFGAGVVLLTSWAEFAGPAVGPARADDTVRTFDAIITAPDGVPLGGSVHVEVHDTGDFAVHFHMHSSSLLGDFDFATRAYLAVPDGPVFFFHHEGHVSGVDDADYDENGNNPLIATYWSSFGSNAPFSVAKDYQWGGIIGTLDSLVRDILDLTGGAVSTAIGAVIGVTREAIGWIGANLGPGGTIGVIAGVAVLVASGGTAVLLATVAGVAAGLVTSALVDTRPMSADEISLAREVFCDKIPYDLITLTNLHTVNNRAFTAPGVDGRTYVNLGPVYDNPLGSDGDAYPALGQVLIHELTHAWQIAHTTFLPGLICSGVVNQVNHSVFGDPIYDYGAAGPDWSAFNLEQQGAIVDQWFAGNGHSSGYAPMAWQNPYAHYIRHNIRFLGQDG